MRQIKKLWWKLRNYTEETNIRLIQISCALVILITISIETLSMDNKLVRG